MIFQIGQQIYWDDPDDGAASGIYTIQSINEDDILISNKYSEAEVQTHELIHLDDLYMCHECGSLDIEEKMWCSINRKTNVITDAVDDDCYFCNTCNQIYHKYPLNVGANINKLKDYEQYND